MNAARYTAAFTEKWKSEARESAPHRKYTRAFLCRQWPQLSHIFIHVKIHANLSCTESDQFHSGVKYFVIVDRPSSVSWLQMFPAFTLQTPINSIHKKEKKQKQMTDELHNPQYYAAAGNYRGIYWTVISSSEFFLCCLTLIQCWNMNERTWGVNLQALLQLQHW